MENDFIIAFLGSPPFFPATMLLLKAGKKGGSEENIAKDRKVIPDPIDDRKFQQ